MSENKTDINMINEFIKETYTPEHIDYCIYVTEKVYNAIQNPTPNIIKCKFNWWDKLKWKFGMRIKVKGAKISDVRFK